MELRRKLRIGTRASELARTQTQWVIGLLAARAPEVDFELVDVVTTGDARRDAPLQSLGVGVFVATLRDALLRGEVDAAVHSYKDVPTDPAAGLTVACVPERARPWDALVSRHDGGLRGLPAGARLGTSSVRRSAFLRAARPDLEITALRGNIDTRLGKVSEDGLDAVVLACAGLDRTGRASAISEALGPEILPPAPAQGALAIEVRADDAATQALVSGIACAATSAAVRAERACLHAFGGGCHVPLAAWAEASDGAVRLHAAVAAVDGSRVVRATGESAATDPERAGREAAAQLAAAGARALAECE